MFNPAMLFKLQKCKDEFVKNHPKFPAFLNAVGKDAISEGTIIEIMVTKTSGETLKTNLKLKESDVELVKEIVGMAGNK